MWLCAMQESAMWAEVLDVGSDVILGILSTLELAPMVGPAFKLLGGIFQRAKDVKVD